MFYLTGMPCGCAWWYWCLAVVRHCWAQETTPFLGRCLEKSERRDFIFPHFPDIWHSVMLKYFGHFTKMSFGFFTKLDYLILDNSLLAVEKLGIVTKPGEACTSFSSAQCFYFLQHWLCSEGLALAKFRTAVTS